MVWSSNKMAQLQHLPTELQLDIALYLPQPALAALAYTCLRLNQVVTPLLLESVHWQGYYRPGRVLTHEAFIPTQRSVIRRSVTSVIQSTGSKIFNLDAFTRTVLSSDSLRSFVKDVDLRWKNDSLNDDDSVRCCLQALESSHLRRLHLSPAEWSFDIPARPAVTSLALKIRGAWTYHQSHLDHENFKRLYTLFCIPSLTHLCLDGTDGWPSWSSLICQGQAWSTSESMGASNVEELSLIGGGTRLDDNLREVLSWPKALKRFTYLPHHHSLFYGFSDNTPHQLQYILQHQRLTLEYLHAMVPEWYHGKKKTIGGMIFYWKLTAENRLHQLGHLEIGCATGLSGSQAISQSTCRAFLPVRLDLLVTPL